MDDLDKYLNLLFGELKGYVYSPVKRPDAWSQEFFSWPDQRSTLKDWIVSNTLDSVADVYISPALYSERKADKASIKGSKVVWVEFDGQEQIDFRGLPTPDAIVQSSLSTHLHCYWEVEPNVKEVIESVNRRLTYFLGADSSGWDATQLLRPPTSINRKRDLPVVLYDYVDDRSVKGIEAFSLAPEVALRASTFESHDLLKATDVLSVKTLPLSLIKMIKLESPVEPFRSQFLTKVAYELAEEGLEAVEIVSLLAFVDDRVGKYVGRTDRLLRLSQITDMALHKITVEDTLTIYTPQDVLDHVQDLQWILPGWLHSSGQMMISSAPGVGKTQLCLQMVMQILSGESFLGKRSFISIPHSIFFMSLEMDVTGLKYILSHQKKQWAKDFPNDRFHIIDEEGSLTRYEDLISELGATVVLVDSLTELFDDTGESATVEARKVMRWCRKVRRRYSCAIVLIHHNRKASEGNKKPKGLADLAGSFQFGKDSETVCQLWEDHKGIEFSTVKARYGVKEAFYVTRDENLWFTRVEKENASTNAGPDKPDEGGFTQKFRGFG